MEKIGCSEYLTQVLILSCGHFYNVNSSHLPTYCLKNLRRKSFNILCSQLDTLCIAFGIHVTEKQELLNQQ